MRKEDKGTVIGQLTETLKEYPNFYLTDIEALDAEKTSKLRRECFKREVKLVVVKKMCIRDRLEAFIQKKVSKLEQYFDGIILAEVTLKVVKPETVKNKQASIMLSVKNGECFADKINDTFEGAIDDCVEALEKQLVKFKEKIRAK